VTDPDAQARTGQTTRQRANQPVRLILTAYSAQPPQQALGDWIRRHPEYRNTVRDTGGRQDGRAGFSDAVVIAVVAQALLPGLFKLLQTWVAQQRRETQVRMRVGESEIEFYVTGRTDPRALLTEVTRNLHAVASQAPAGTAAPAGLPASTGVSAPVGSGSYDVGQAPSDRTGVREATEGEPAPAEDVASSE
jgi:hypothetical protein